MKERAFSDQDLLVMSTTQGVPEALAKMAAAWLEERQITREVDLFLSEIRAENLRARKKFPSSDGVVAALTEETGELAKAVMEEPWENVRMEAVQVASTAMRVALEGDFTLNIIRERRGMPPCLVTPAKEDGSPDA